MFKILWANTILILKLVRESSTTHIEENALKTTPSYAWEFRVNVVLNW